MSLLQSEELKKLCDYDPTLEEILELSKDINNTLKKQNNKTKKPKSYYKRCCDICVIQ